MLTKERSRLQQSGIISSFLTHNNFEWTHDKWLALVSQIRRRDYVLMSDDDIGALLEAEKTRLLTSAARNSADTLRCSFCHKTQSQIAKLISAPSDFPRAYICNECVMVCVDILEIDVPTTPGMLDLAAFGITPPFKTLKFELKPNHCFHLCPFAPPFNEIYLDYVMKAAQTAGFTIERADEIFGTDSIIEDIWQSIGSATAITADVTGRNPNVMYEIGMAHTLGKPVVIMTQTMDDVPFDLRHNRCLVYQFTPRGCTDLMTRLTNTLRFLKGATHSRRSAR